jgi:hypothetical protein
MISLATVLNDSLLLELLKKFPDLKIDDDGTLHSYLITKEGSIVFNTFELGTVEQYGEYKVWLYFYYLDDKTQKIIYSSNHTRHLVGLKHKPEEEKFQLFANLAELREILLSNYPKALALRALYKIQSLAIIETEEERRLLEINEHFRLLDGLIVVKNLQSLLYRDLEKIKEIVKADELEISGKEFDWMIRIVKS